MKPLYAPCQADCPYFFFAPDELPEELPEELLDDRLLPTDDLDPPPDERELPTDEREPPDEDRAPLVEGGRGADVRPGLLRTELVGRPRGAPVSDRVVPPDEGERPPTEEPVGGTTTGREYGEDLPALALGATNCRPEPVLVLLEGDTPADGEVYMVGR